MCRHMRSAESCPREKKGGVSVRAREKYERVGHCEQFYGQREFAPRGLVVYVYMC